MTWVLGREFSYLGGGAELNKFRSADQPMRPGVQCQLSPAADMPSIRPCARRVKCELRAAEQLSASVDHLVGVAEHPLHYGLHDLRREIDRELAKREP